MVRAWRCPRCGAVALMEPRYGDEILAVYDLCTVLTDPRGATPTGGGNHTPVRMEELSLEQAQLLASTRTAKVEREPVLAR